MVLTKALECASSCHSSPDTCSWLVDLCMGLVKERQGGAYAVSISQGRKESSHVTSYKLEAYQTASSVAEESLV